MADQVGSVVVLWFVARLAAGVGVLIAIEVATQAIAVHVHVGGREPRAVPVAAGLEEE